MPVRIDIDDWSGRRSITGVVAIGNGPVGELVDRMVALVRGNLPDDEIEQALTDVERYLFRD